MTEHDPNIDPLDAAYKAEEARLRAENEQALSKSEITFLGGPADGESMDIPNGVTELEVESVFGAVVYIRDPESPELFVPRKLS